jgi:hypothetical protein
MPDAPPAEPKKSLFEKLGAGLPIGLTALATILAGMSTGELNRAMLWRSNAAQDQAKANGQWSLAGFKRDRALICDTTAATLKAADNYRRPEAIPPTDDPEGVKRVARWMNGGEVPDGVDVKVKEVLKAVREQQPESVVLAKAREVNPDKLQEEITAALKQEAELDTLYKRESDAVKAAFDLASELDEGSKRPKGNVTGTTAARYEVDARRYRAEATANQWVGFLLEVRVKYSTEESERHQHRSENFFFAMLAAQVGGVGSSLALARKRKSVLWLVAALFGLAAVGIGAFVYVTM